MPVEDKPLSVQDYFRKYKKPEETENIDKEIMEVLRAVNLKTDLEKVIDKFS
jgi:hypothetical protein